MADDLRSRLAAHPLLDELTNRQLDAIVEIARRDHAAHLWSLSASAGCYVDETMLDEAATRADPGEADRG